MVKAVFLDRDGVINEPIVRNGKPYAPTTLATLKFYPDVAESITRLKAAGFKIVVATNQPDVKNGLTTLAFVEMVHDQIRSQFGVDRIEACMHTDEDGCACRKPKPGMLNDAAKALNIDLTRSFMVGDRWRDVDAGRAAGCGTVLIDRGYTEGIPNPPDAVVLSLAAATDYILKIKA